VLGEIGDTAVLQELREQLSGVSQEHQGLVIAVGTLKKRLWVK
jgi:hypothetical protein